jgi:ankyrin repeat protein
MSHFLRQAAASGNTEKLKERLAAGDDIESRDKGTGRTALLEAVIAGHRDAAALLIEKGADAGASCKAVGMDSLGWAVEIGHGELVEDLLALGMNPNRVPESSFLGATPLMIAAQRGHLGIARRLAEAGADPGALDRSGRSALALAEEGHHAELAAFLRTLPGSEPAPPPLPKIIPWPALDYDLGGPIPDGASPAQVARGFILAMYRWETAAHLAIEEADAKGAPSDMNAALAQARAIRDLYCTAKKRAYSRASVGCPPYFAANLAMLAEEYPKPRRCEILTRNAADSPGDFAEILFVLLQKQGRWRIDSAKNRLVGELSWSGMIL